MKTQVEKLPQSRVALEIEVEPSRVEQALDRAYRKVVRSVDIPGFRRGRAPRALVEMRFGRETLLQEAFEELIPQAYRQAVEEAAIQPIGEPSFDVGDAPKGEPFRFKAEVDVKPVVELGPYRGLKGERVIQRVKDEDVDAVLAAYQDRFTQLGPTEREVSETGDFAVIDFEGFVDGKPFQGGAARGYLVELGAGTLLPGFEEQLVGRTVGESFEVNVTFPDDGVPEELKGRDAVFQVTLNELKVKQVPAIDDDLAQEAGEADTLEEWREVIRQRLEEQARESAEERLRNDLFSAVVDNSNMELPESLVEAELQGLIQEMAGSLARQGISLEQYFQQTETDLDALRESLRSRAEWRARSFLVLDALGEKEQITVSDEEIEAELENMFANRTPGEEERRNLAGPVADFLRRRKIIDLLVAEAQIEERWVDSLEADAEAGEPEAEGSPESE